MLYFFFSGEYSSLDLDRDHEMMFVSTSLNFDDARTFCHQHGGIVFEERWGWHYTGNPGGIGNYWLGIHDKDTEGTFVFDSDDKSISTNRWANGEPNNIGGEDCVEVDVESDKLWNDVPCTDKLSVICARDIPGKFYEK